MKIFEIGFKNLYVVYDKDYGSEKQSGWSIAINYCYCVEFEKNLIVALYKAYKIYKEFYKDEE